MAGNVPSLGDCQQLAAIMTGHVSDSSAAAVPSLSQSATLWIRLNG